MPNKLPNITLRGEAFKLRRMQYGNGRVAYTLESEFGEPFMKITVNLPDHYCAPGEFFVKTWGENEPYIPGILASGVFIDTGRRVETGGYGCQAAIWRLANNQEEDDATT